MPRPALSQLWGSYTAAEMPRSFSSHTSPRDVLMVVVDSRTLVKDSARLSLRGVHGVATGVDFKWLALPQAGVGAELRLGVTRVSSSEGCRMRQVVKVKVELVCDMHFPGWWACAVHMRPPRTGFPGFNALTSYLNPPSFSQSDWRTAVL